MTSQRATDHTWLVVCAVVAVVLLGGGAAVWTNGVPELDVGGTGPATAATRPGPDASLAPGATPRTALVRLDGAAAGSPAGAGVVELLDRHFAAINSRDFSRWAGTVTSERAGTLTPQRWQRAYRTTVDSSVVVTAIDPGPSGLLVSLSFVSEQDPADAPADLQVARICWTSRWPLDAAGARIGIPAKGATSRRAC